MVELTDAARRCLDEYLAEVRSSLRACPSVDPADVERDVLEHIDHALDGAGAAVDVGGLRRVLQELGSPARWVPREELGRLQRAGLAFRTGPEDLRLGYLAFGLLAGTLLTCACLNLALGLAGLVPFLLLGIAASFVFARASVSAAESPTAAERWLIYPSLIVVYAPATALLLLWPVPAAVIAEAILIDPGRPRGLLELAGGRPAGAIAAFVLGTAGCLWWAALGFVAWRWPAVVRDCYAPFADRFRRRRRFLILSGVCLAAFLACLAVGLQRRHPYF